MEGHHAQKSGEIRRKPNQGKNGIILCGPRRQLQITIPLPHQEMLP
jgi:hypothetical protein